VPNKNGVFFFFFFFGGGGVINCPHFCRGLRVIKINIEETDIATHYPHPSQKKGEILTFFFVHEKWLLSIG